MLSLSKQTHGTPSTNLSLADSASASDSDNDSLSKISQDDTPDEQNKNSFPPEVRFKNVDFFLIGVSKEDERNGMSQITQNTRPQENTNKEKSFFNPRMSTDLRKEEKDTASQASRSTKKSDIRPGSVNGDNSSVSTGGNKRLYKVISQKSNESYVMETHYEEENNNNPKSEEQEKEKEKEKEKVSWTVLRIIGMLIVLVSIGEMGVGAKAENLIVNQTNGAWWAGMIGVIAGIAAILSPWSLNLMIVTSLTTSPAIVSSIVGAFTDGYAAETYFDLISCARQDDPGTNNVFSFYGATAGSAYAASAQQCYEEYAVASPSQFDCVCVTSQNHCTSDFQVFQSTDCGLVLDNYPKLLFASMLFCMALGILCLVGSVISCYNVWHKEEKIKKIEKNKSLYKLSSSSGQTEFTV
jgi:hypothetical protein